MATTDYLKLRLTGDESTDLSQTFHSWRQTINGESDSNMHIIDDAFKNAEAKVEDQLAEYNSINLYKFDNGYSSTPTGGIITRVGTNTYKLSGSVTTDTRAYFISDVTTPSAMPAFLVAGKEYLVKCTSTDPRIEFGVFITTGGVRKDMGYVVNQQYTFTVPADASDFACRVVVPANSTVNCEVTLEIKNALTNKELQDNLDAFTKYGYGIEDQFIQPRMTSFFEPDNNLVTLNSDTVKPSNTSSSYIPKALHIYPNGFYVIANKNTNFLWIEFSVPTTGVYYLSWSIIGGKEIRVYKSNKTDFIVHNDNASGESLLFEGTQGTMYIRISIPANGVVVCNRLMITANKYSRLKSEVLPQRIELLGSQWANATWASYGDSITAQANEQDINANGFQRYVKHGLNLGKTYVRGIGGQTFIWNTKTWYANPDGTYGGRPEIGSEMQPDQSEHKGSFCSWDRIRTMFPDRIRESIQLIVVMGGTNDFGVMGSTDAFGDKISFSSDYNFDTDWTSAVSYNGGDFDIRTLKGAVASTIMKLQIRCPNALIVVCSPISRWNMTTNNPVTLHGFTTRDVSDAILDAARQMSTPTIDVNGNCSLNNVNYNSTYFSDDVHPNSAGQRMLAKAIIGGMNGIVPMFESTFIDL